MANDYIPADDPSLATFASDFSAYIEDGFANVGLLIGDFTALDGLQGDFAAKLAASNNAKTVATVAREGKDLSRTTLVNSLRSLARRIQAFPGTTAAELAALGLTVRDTTPTVVPAPTTQPVLFVDTSSRLQHIINFRDSATPSSKAKPAGVLGIELYRKVGGTAPADLSQCDFLAMDTATPYTIDYVAAQGGEMVYFIGRWVNRNGQSGPISDVISATVVA